VSSREEDELVEKILNNPKLVDALVKRVYDKLRDDIILKKLDEHGEIIKKLVENVNELKKSVDELRKSNEELRKDYEELRKSNEELRKSTEELRKGQEELRKVVQDNTDHITLLWEAMYMTWKEIRDLKEENKRIWESIEKMNKTMRSEFKRLEIMITSFTSRAGHHVERTIMNLYKKALELHGIKPSKVMHGYVEDKYGVFAKGRKFEVDFYETNDYIYIFEIKNHADEGAIEQLEIREKIFSTLYNKPIKKFIIANSIEKELKEKAESLGITVISGFVVE